MRNVAAYVVGTVSAVVTAALLWPTSNCVSTLILAAPGQPDPNKRSCMSVIGLPGSRVVAVIAAVCVGALAYAFVRSRRRNAATRTS